MDAEYSSDASDYNMDFIHRRQIKNPRQLGIYLSLYTQQIKKDMAKWLASLTNQYYSQYGMFIDENNTKDFQNFPAFLQSFRQQLEQFEDCYLKLKQALPLQKRKSKIQDFRKIKMVDLVDKMLIRTHYNQKSTVDEDSSKINSEEELNRAQELYNNQHYEKAILLAKSLIKKKESAELYFLLGNCYKATNEFSQALIEYNKCIKIHPKSYYFNNRGNCCLAKRDLHSALQDYQKAIELEPENDIYHGNYGNVCLSLNFISEAEKAYTSALRCNATKDCYYNNRAYANIKLKKKEAAVEDYTKAININPTEHIYLKNRANILLEQKKYREATCDLKQALDIEPNKPEYYYLLAKCQYLNENVNQALVSIRKALDLEPKKNYQSFYQALKSEIGYQ